MRGRMCPCGKAIESRTQRVGECEKYKERRGVLEEEMREIDECGTGGGWCATVDSSEKTIAILQEIDGGHTGGGEGRGQD